MTHTITLLVHEVFDLVSKASTKEQKIQILKDNESWALKDVLRGMHDERIVWLLPTGSPPPYEPAPENSPPSNLSNQNKKFTYFVKGGKGDDLSPLKRETLFIRLLESIHPKDALLLISMINKKAPPKTVTKTIAKEAFPNLFP